MGKKRNGWSMGSTVGAAVLLIVGCAEVGTEPADRMNLADAEAVARFLAEGDAFAAWMGEILLDQRAGTRTFSQTTDCPGGGKRSFTGSATHTRDEATRTVSATWSNTQSHDACVFIERRGDVRVARMVDGSITATGEGRYRMPEERDGARTILAYTSTRAGSTTTTVDGKSRTCTVDVTESYDPATQSFTLRGTVCGREVNITRTAGGSQQ